ncbi:MAG: hypothetical protein GEU91_07635 [Rhizobiales bacterium]|nr:hypothetical protein [Hyphomicrobiales bacterium]
MTFSFLERLKPEWRYPSNPAEQAWPNEDAPAPPRGAASGIGRLLWTGTRPLIHPDARMIITFSAKSACTTVTVWFLHHLGHAKAAHDFHHWPHNYRAKVYYRSQIYLNAFDLDLSRFKLVKIVRDPFDRAVSSFRHALRTGIADADIVRLLGRQDLQSAGLSFSEFLDFLELTDLQTCNPHYRVQRHPIEDALPVHHLINISTENLYRRLNDVEADLGLPRTYLAEMPWIKAMNDRRFGVGGVSDVTDAYAVRFNRRTARRGPWPSYRALLTPVARERLARLYAVDVEAYANQPGSPGAPDQDPAPGPGRMRSGHGQASRVILAPK